MSQIPKKSGLPKPQTVRTISSRTYTVPNTGEVITETRTRYENVQPCNRTGGPSRRQREPEQSQPGRQSSCTAPCSTPPHSGSQPSSQRPSGIGLPTGRAPAASQSRPQRVPCRALQSQRMSRPQSGMPSRPTGIPPGPQTSSSVPRPQGISLESTRHGPQASGIPQGGIPCPQISRMSRHTGAHHGQQAPDRSFGLTSGPPSYLEPRSGMPSRTGGIPCPHKSGASRPTGIPQGGMAPPYSARRAPQQPQASPMETPSKLTYGGMAHPQATSTPLDRKPQMRSGLRPPSGHHNLEQTLDESIAVESASRPNRKVTAKDKQVNVVCPPETIRTLAGDEVVLQKMVIEQRVERDAEGEKVFESVTSSDLDKGKVQTVQIGIEQLNPRFSLPKGKEVIGVIKTISVTDTCKTTSKECTRITTEPKVTMSPEEVAHLVEEEKEDVENTLKMIPPDLVLEPGRYEIKQRLQKLRIHSESMALLEQSIIQPEPTADEAQAEPTPEAVAVVMHSVEKGISPQSAPDEVFNTLFKETANERFIKLSSITPGPLQDVVTPIGHDPLPKEIHEEVLCEDVVKLSEVMTNRHSSEDVPPNDLFHQTMEDAKKSPEKGKNKPKSYQPITDDQSVWANADLEHLVNVVGADPVEVLHAMDSERLEDKELDDALRRGIEYYLEAEPVQYMSRVQLRGSQPPSYFPGYVLALPELPGLMKIARNPDEVYVAAWRATQPKYFEDESMLTLRT